MPATPRLGHVADRERLNVNLARLGREAVVAVTCRSLRAFGRRIQPRAGRRRSCNGPPFRRDARFDCRTRGPGRTVRADDGYTGWRESVAVLGASAKLTSRGRQNKQRSRHSGAYVVRRFREARLASGETFERPSQVAPRFAHAVFGRRGIGGRFGLVLARGFVDLSTSDDPPFSNVELGGTLSVSRCCYAKSGADGETCLAQARNSPTLTGAELLWAAGCLGKGLRALFARSVPSQDAATDTRSVPQVCELCGAPLDVPLTPRVNITIVSAAGKPTERVLRVEGRELHRCQTRPAQR